MKSDQIFEFNLSQTNRIKPRQIDKINVKTMIRNKEIDKINEVINDLSQENFDENGINYFSKNCYVDYFDLKKDDRKGLKTFQLLTQYMIYSINHLKKKQEIMNDLYNKQLGYNETADRIIYKQMELANKNLNSNCVSMEHLLKHMNLEDVVLKLGASGENFNRNDDKDLKYSLNKKNDQDDEDRVDYSSDEDM